MTRKNWELVRNNIETDVYKIIRLCELRDGKFEVIIPFNKPNEKALIERYNYIKSRVDKNLSAGTYQLQCRVSSTNFAIQDNFEIIIPENRLTVNQAIDKTNEQTSDDMAIDWHEHLELVKENERLKSLNCLLETERNFYKQQLELRPQHTPLADAVPIKTTGEIIGNVLNDIAPSLFNLGEKYMSLMEKRLDNDSIRMQNQQPKQKTKMQPNNGIDENLILSEVQRLEALENESEEAFTEALDKLEADNMPLYLEVCKRMDITFED
jgi:hypothetical protein